MHSNYVDLKPNFGFRLLKFPKSLVFEYTVITSRRWFPVFYFSDKRILDFISEPC